MLWREIKKKIIFFLGRVNYVYKIRKIHNEEKYLDCTLHIHILLCIHAILTTARESLLPLKYFFPRTRHILLARWRILMRYRSISLYKSYLIRVIVEPLAIHVPRQLSRWPWTDCHADDVVFPIRAEGRVFAAEYHHAQGPHWNTEEDRGRSQEWTTWIARGRWWTPDQKARTRIAAAAELRCLERPRTCTVRPLPNAF